MDDYHYSMKPFSVQTIFFSPTGNTKQICSRIAFGLGGKMVDPINLTNSNVRTKEKIELIGDLIIIGTPVYVGRIPQQILEPLEKLKGKNQWCVIVAVNGGVQAGTVLAELTAILKTQNFRILAAANITGVHSFIHEGFPLGKGRPDNNDLIKLQRFTQSILDKLADDPQEISFPDPNIDYTLPHPQVRAKILADPPEKDDDICIECRECYAHCPNDAIDFTTLHIDDQKCIRCFACVRICAWNARSIKLHLNPELRELFSTAIKSHYPTEFFL